MSIRITLRVLVTTAIFLALAGLVFSTRSAGGETQLTKPPKPHVVPAVEINVALAAKRSILIDQRNRVLWNNTVLWNKTVAENKARDEAAAAAARAAMNQTSPAPVDHGQHGPHSDAWWHGVSICEQSGRNDSYFGYFSYMDGSAAGKTWAQQVAMGNKTVAQYGEDMNSGGAWAHKCVMAGYAASPGG